MSLVRRIARPLIAAPFVYEGVRTAITPERSTDVAPEAFAELDAQLQTTALPSSVDARMVFRAAGVMAATAGLAYASGRFPRLASLALLGTTTIGWAGRKRVWELRGEELTAEIEGILKDAGLLGSVLLAAVDTDGRPSTAYRWNRFVQRAQKNAAANSAKAKMTSKSLRTSADSFSKSAAKSFDAFAQSAAKSGDAFLGSAAKSLDEAAKGVNRASKKLAKQLG